MANPLNQDCEHELMETIQGIMNDVSPYAAAYRNMAQIEREEQARAVHENRPPSEVSMVMREGEDRRRYNAPLNEEVAATISLYTIISFYSLFVTVSFLCCFLFLG